MKKKVYNCAVIGCGRIGSILEQDKLRPHPCTHSGAYYNHPQTRLITGCDINKERLSLFGKEWNICSKNLYTDYRKLLKRNDIDIVSIATDTETHFKIISEALKNKNIKIVLLEKPVVATVNEAKKLKNLINKTGKKIVVNHERRFNWRYILVKNYIDKKKYGSLKTITGNVITNGIKKDWHSDWKKSGGGTLLHDGTHLIDIILYFVGAIKYLSGSVEFPNDSEYCVETSATAMIKFVNGVIGFVEASSNREYFNFELDLQFQKGRIKIGNGILSFWKKKISSRYEGFYDLVKDDVKFNQGKNFFIEVVDDIVKAIETKNYDSKSTIIDGLNAYNTIMAIYHSGINKNKKIIFPFKPASHPFENKNFRHKRK